MNIMKEHFIDSLYQNKHFIFYQCSEVPSYSTHIITAVLQMEQEKIYCVAVNPLSES